MNKTITMETHRLDMWLRSMPNEQSSLLNQAKNIYQNGLAIHSENKQAAQQEAIEIMTERLESEWYQAGHHIIEQQPMHPWFQEMIMDALKAVEWDELARLYVSSAAERYQSEIQSNGL